MVLEEESFAYSEKKNGSVHEKTGGIIIKLKKR